MFKNVSSCIEFNRENRIRIRVLRRDIGDAVRDFYLILDAT